MKKSKMLTIIEDAIDRACGNDGVNRLYPDDSYLAYCILKRIEKAGMLPPNKEHWRDIEVNEWEEE